MCSDESFKSFANVGKQERKIYRFLRATNTKNPHAFDKNTFAYYLMMHGNCLLFLKVDFPKNKSRTK